MTAILVSTDTAPTITGTIVQSDGEVPPLGGATVYFQLRLASERRWRINAEATIEDADAGIVSYDLSAEDLDFAGDCVARWLVVYADLRRQHTTPAVEVTVQQQ